VRHAVPAGSSASLAQDYELDDVGVHRGRTSPIAGCRTSSRPVLPTRSSTIRAFCPSPSRGPSVPTPPGWRET
jgi:hypothetical protein